MPKLQIPPKLLPFLEKKKRFKVALGGRGGGKSQSMSDLLLMCASYGERIGCFREFQNSIDDSVHALLKDEVERLKIPGFNITKTELDHSSGGGFRFKGLARNPDSVKSMFGFKKFWVEEAQSVSADSLKLLTPTLRTDDSEIWLSLNPMSSADPVSQRFIEPFREELFRDGIYEDDLHLIVLINYMDNPWFPASLEQERLFDYENLPRAMYDHIWMGAYNDTVENAIILAEWFDAAVDAHEKLGFKPRGLKIVSHDPSDEGNDDKAVVVRHGSVILDAAAMKDGDVADGMDWALEYAINSRADLFTWDCDGLGISLKRQVEKSLRGKHVDYVLFKGSEGVDFPDHIYDGNFGDKNRQRTNKETFRNKRAQYYWQLRDRFFNTYRAVVKGEYIDPDKMISISSNIKALPQLKSEVCRIPRKPNANGFIQIMSKEAMKKMKIHSPNMADCMMMSLFNNWTPLPNYGDVDVMPEPEAAY